MPALDGVKVLDLSRVLAGPWCTQSLADLGAEVWKIESLSGDDTRTWSPPEIGGESTYFLCCNRTKSSIAIDLKQPEGQQLIRDLASKADVLVENFKLGTMERFGLGYDKLSALNPRLIYCAISGYGRTGPRRQEPGYDFAIQAESGLMSITGEVDGEPMKLGVAITDICAGMNATQSILAAIIARHTTGMGQFIDIALLDGAVALLANVASGYLATGKTPTRFGNAHPTVVPYQIFKTADTSIALAVGNDRQFSDLCKKVLDCPELATDERFKTNRSRGINREVLIPILEKHFLRFSTAEVIAALRSSEIPVGEVRDVPSALNSPEVVEREMVVKVSDRLHGELKLGGSPLALRGTPVAKPTAPPRLGEHTREVLQRVLNIGGGELAKLEASKTVFQSPRT